MKTIQEVREYIEILDRDILKRASSLTNTIETISYEIEKLEDLQTKSLLEKAREHYIHQYRKTRLR